MKDYKSFETTRLLLKTPSVDDAPFIYRLFNTPKFIKYIGDRNIHSVDDAVLDIRTKKLPQLKKLGFSNYTVILKSNGTKIGTCGLFDREGIDGIDLGFALLPEYENLGYAFESASRIKEAAFSEFGLKELWGITTPDNFSSQKLLRKLGFELVGNTTLPNDKNELLLFKLDKN